ncbi:MAG: site-2 protease family protein [Alphaproteobacteria bacterium]
MNLSAFSDILFKASIWVLPVIIAVTFHEVAHGVVANWLGDDTAYRQGRVNFNPLKHVDPFGTILLPALLLMARSPFLFGYAKPVPVNFGRLNHPKRDMIWVAAAGPGMNILLAILSGLLIHLTPLLPGVVGPWASFNLSNSIVINIVLAVFNMLPLPPLDGGRVLVGLLPLSLARPFARIERWGMFILIAVLFILPMVGRELNMDLNVISWLMGWPAEKLFEAIVWLTGSIAFFD